jgi:phosphate transport system protein
MTEYSQGHIVAVYDAEFKKLGKLLSRMGGLAESQLANALTAIERRDNKLAKAVKAADKDIDALEREIEALVVRMLALRQPVANDLRYIVATLRISSDLERVGDYAKNIAKRVIALNSLPSEPLVRGILRVGRPVQQMLKEVMDANLQGDVAKAIEVWEADEEVDSLYTGLFRELLTYMMEDPRHITPCTHLLFIAKNLERIGDHATNIAEITHFQVEGESLVERRPKADASNYAVLTPGDLDDDEDDDDGEDETGAEGGDNGPGFGPSA